MSVASQHKPNYTQELKELRDTLAWSDAVMTGISESVIVTDQAWRIIYTNSSFAELAKQSRIFLLGARLWDKLELRQDGITIENLIDQLPIKDSAELDGTYLISSGDRELTVAAKFTHIAKVNQTVIVLRDITESIVLDEMKSEFINIVSHQLRTPLAGIMIYAHLLGDGYAGELTNSQQKLLKTVIDSTDRTIELVGTFLSIARIESGRVSINPQPIDMNKLLHTVIDESKLRALEHKVKLVEKISPKLPEITTDKLLIKEVVINLLSNAIKYTPAKGTVTISTEVKGKDLVVSVKDTGCGIPELEQNQVFSRFFRGTNVIMHETEGTGLGLYLVKLIIQVLDGRIWFDSKENKGTTFWFSLPISGSVAVQKHRRVNKPLKKVRK